MSLTSEDLQDKIKTVFKYIKDNAVIFETVSATSSDNPSQKGWFEKADSKQEEAGVKYVLSTDTNADTSKTYYTFDDSLDCDEYFRENFAQAIIDWISEGTVTTTDVGSISAGAFTGTGSGSCSLSSYKSQLVSALKTASDNMKSNPSVYKNQYFVQQLASGLDSMIGAENTVSTTVNGTATSGSSSTPIAGASAVGKIVLSPTFSAGTFVSETTNFCNAMTGNDDSFAEFLGAKISSAILSSTITTNGTGTISGSTGTGNIT